jgi:hypothetical protein
MNKAQRVFIIAFLMFTAVLLLIGEAKSWRPRLWTPRGATAPRTAAPHSTAAAAAARHQYVRSHDYNHDGKVDVKDRLVWIRDRAGAYDTVYITDEDGDLYEVMDINNDGQVDATEIKIFYDIYDTNKNGVLEDAEIDAAVD